MKKTFLTLSIFLFLTSVSKSQRTFFNTTINDLIKNGYTIIKVTDLKDGETVYHLTNGKEVLICNSGFSWNYSRCSRD